MKNVNPAAMSGMAMDWQTRLLRIKRRSLVLLRNTSAKTFIGIGVVVAGALFCGAAIVSVTGSNAELATAEVPSVTQLPSTSKSVSTAASMAAVPSPEALGLVQTNLTLQTKGLAKVQNEVVEVKTMSNAHTTKIQSVETEVGVVKESIKDDPKVLQALRDNAAALQKMIDAPTVRLIPMTQSSGANKPTS